MINIHSIKIQGQISQGIAHNPTYGYTIPGHGHPIGPPPGLSAVGINHPGMPSATPLPQNQGIPTVSGGLPPNATGITQSQNVVPPNQGGLPPNQAGIPSQVVLQPGQNIPHGMVPNPNHMALPGQVPPGFQQPSAPGGQPPPKVDAQTAELISFD